MKSSATAGSVLMIVASLGALPSPARAQTLLPDPLPAKTLDSRYAGGRVMKSGLISQFDSLGRMPMGYVGDSVTAYLFLVGDQLSRVVHAKITKRQRFIAPASWRAACDEIAHPGWMYSLSAPSRAPFGVVIPGTYPRPEVKPPPPASRAGAWQFYRQTVDSAWRQYRATMKPATDRAADYMSHDFWGPSDDGRLSQLKIFGVRGAGGRNYAAFSFALRDDYPGDTPNTARTWIVDAWGYPVVSITGNPDIYGTVDDGGVDAIVTSSGLIRWDGTQWVLPQIYSEEPCLYRRTMPLPPGAHP